MSRFLSITLAAALVLTLGIASVLSVSPGVNALTGGPDSYGYYFTDSTEGGGPSYSFVDISGTGTPLGLTDDDYTSVPIGFSFDFYGASYSNVYVQSNGALTFDDWEISYDNYSLPYEDGDDSYYDYYGDPFIAVFWDDLNPGYAGEIYYETVGSSPNRALVVQWDGLPQWYDIGAVTFEAILYEGSNDIILQYADTDYDDSSYDWGADATVGIQEDDSNALEYSCDSAVITNPLAILFYYTAPANTPPDIPTLNSPGDGATDVVLTPDLVFDYFDADDDVCTSFNIRVDDDPMFCSLDINDSVSGSWPSPGPITYNVTTPLAPDTQYYWMVNASDGTDWSVWSDGSWDFTTGDQTGGSDKNTYRTNQDVYVNAAGFPTNSDVDVYVVAEGEWMGGENIAGYGISTMETFTTDGAGNIVNELLWHAPLDLGEYDIVFDAGQDGFYDDIPDLVDDPNHPGFTVVSSKVGGEVYSIDKAALLLPWLGLGLVLVLAAGGLILVRRAGRLR